MAVLLPNGKQSYSDNAGAPLNGGKVYTYGAGTNVPQATWKDANKVAANTNPIILDARGEAAVFWDGAYKVTLHDANDNLIWSIDNIASDTLRADLALPTGSSLVGYKSLGANAIATTVQNQLRAGTVYATTNFGADNTGLTNATAALLNFFNACISLKLRGRIPAGTYMITPGALLFDNGFTDAAWPFIETDDYQAVTFTVDPASVVDAPIITIKNGNPNSDVGKYWRGGSLGGIKFTDPRVGAYTGTHGLSMQGWINGEIGYLLGVSLNGSTFYEPLAGNAGNPDPAAISAATFRGIEAQFCKGWAWLNLNGVGMDSVTIDYIRAISCSGGGFFGIGQGCKIKSMSFGSSLGWAFDDGSAAGTVSTNRNTIGETEIDTCQYGMRLNRMSVSDFAGIRFNMRPTGDYCPLNTEGVYYPKTCISLAEGVSPAAIGLNFTTILRLDPITAAQIAYAAGHGYPNPNVQTLGTFLSTTAGGGSVAGVNLDVQLLDQSGRGLTLASLFTGFNNNSRITLTSLGMPFYNTQLSRVALSMFTPYPALYYSAAFSAASFLTAAARVAMNVERIDWDGDFDPANSWYLVPWSGLARVMAKITMTTSIAQGGKPVRIAIATWDSATSTVISILCEKTFCTPYIAPADPNRTITYDTGEQIVSVTAGDKLVLMFMQAAGAGITADAITSIDASNIFQIEML